MTAPPVDVLIVGAGAAGCTAAVYLRRYHRRIMVLDAGNSRLTWLPRAHNVPGYPAGVSGPDLHRQLREQAHRYAGVIESATVTGLVRKGDYFEAMTSTGQVHARAIVLATGVDLIKPEIEGIDDAIQRGIVRFCPICDGYEATAVRVAVVGHRPGAIEEAHFLRTFTEHVSYFPERSDGVLDGSAAAKAAAAGIAVSTSVVESYVLGADHVVIHAADGSETRFDVLYPCLGCVPSSQLAQRLGVACDADGAIVVDDHCGTSIAGVYAAGDVICGIDQIATAFGNAAVAATALHNDLRALEARHA